MRGEWILVFVRNSLCDDFILCASNVNFYSSLMSLIKICLLFWFVTWWHFDLFHDQIICNNIFYVALLWFSIRMSSEHQLWWKEDCSSEMRDCWFRSVIHLNRLLIWVRAVFCNMTTGKADRAPDYSLHPHTRSFSGIDSGIGGCNTS